MHQPKVGRAHSEEIKAYQRGSVTCYVNVTVE